MNKQELAIKHKINFYDIPIDLFCIIHTESHQIIQANTAFEYILGWKETEVIGKALQTFASTDSNRENIDKAFSKIKLGIHSLTFEAALKAKNDTIRDIDWKCCIDAENQCIYAIGRDITQHKETQKLLIQQSHHDTLTGLNNRQTFLTLLQQELSSTFRYQYATAILLLNIDHFRHFNQQYGERQGDECIKHIANTLKTVLRRKTDFLARFDTDFLARFDGDEFIILLTHNDLEKALKSAEYLRENINKTGKVTLSFSICALPDKTDKEFTIDHIIGALKEAMRLNRQNGTNQINYVSNLS